MKSQFILCFVTLLICSCGVKQHDTATTNSPLDGNVQNEESLEGVFEIAKITEKHETCTSDGEPVSIPNYRYYQFQTEPNSQTWKVKKRLCKDESCSSYWSYDPDGAIWNSQGFWAYPISSYGCGWVSEVNPKIFLQFTREEILQTKGGLKLEMKRYRLEFDEFDCAKMKTFITEHQHEFLCHSKISVAEYRKVR